MIDIFVEKYRPNNIEDVVLNENYYNIFKSMIDKKQLTGNLLFYGAAGVGKCLDFSEEIEIEMEVTEEELKMLEKYII
ncbi:MAG: hypothetical protein ABSG25_03800 [Bryobacteraceae bacterium]